MRDSTALLRWGLTCLLLAPVAVSGWVASQGRPALLWAALALVVLGGALNALALVRAVRRPGSNDLLTVLDGRAGSGPGAARSARAAAAAPGIRRRIGLGAVAALLGLIALGAWSLAVEQPLAIAAGQLTLDEVYAVWSPGSRLTFGVGLGLWGLIATAAVLIVAVAALWPAGPADRLLPPRRMLAAACVAGSVIVVTAWGPYFAIGNSLPDELPFAAGGVASPASVAFGATGVALSAAAILLTVPRWTGRERYTRP